MATKPKKKSLYSRKLKDISGDGKKNLADTYLGDLIGLDGKIGIGKKNPGLKASLKGARREDGTTKKPAAKKKKPAPAKVGSGEQHKRSDVKLPKKKKTPNPNLKPNRNGVDKAPPGHGFEVSPTKKLAAAETGVFRKGMKPDAKDKAQVLRNMKKISFKEWDAMTVKQRKDVGLPTNKLQLPYYGKGNFKKSVPRNRRPGSK